MLSHERQQRHSEDHHQWHLKSIREHKTWHSLPDDLAASAVSVLRWPQRELAAQTT
jgi:hypothetical protein